MLSFTSPANRSRTPLHAAGFTHRIHDAPSSGDGCGLTDEALDRRVTDENEGW